MRGEGKKRSLRKQERRELLLGCEGTPEVIVLGEERRGGIAAREKKNPKRQVYERETYGTAVHCRRKKKRGGRANLDEYLVRQLGDGENQVSCNCANKRESGAKKIEGGEGGRRAYSKRICK